MIEEQKIKCMCFGGHTWHSAFRDFLTDHVDEFCYLDEFELQTNTEGNTCEELGGVFKANRRGIKICQFPLENVDKLRKREHPHYSDILIDQVTYEFIVESAQARNLTKEFVERQEPGHHDKGIDALTKKPFASVHRIKDIDGNNIKTEKVKDLHLTKAMAKRLVDSMETYIIEMDVKDRMAYYMHGRGYYELSDKEQAKIRYRINKHTRDFKI